MPAITSSLTRELEDLETIRFVTSALFDVSAEKIGRLKEAFERNHTFFADISALYSAVKQTALRRNDLPHGVEEVRRVVYVPYTSNARFYGASNIDVMRTFARMRAAQQVDVLVIGKTGEGFLKDHPHLANRVSYLSFEDDDPTPREMQQFLVRVAAYDEVHVLYPSFVNVFTQTVVDVDITHAPAPAEPGGVEDEMDYLFEPELPKVLRFFETRIRYVLFERAVLETELSRTAARLFSMNRAQDRADAELKVVRREARSQIETANDMRLLESFAAIAKWKT